MARLYGNQQFDATHDAQGNSTTPPPLTPEQIAARAQVVNTGTTHSTTQAAIQDNAWRPIDPRNYMYGRDPVAAAADVKLAQDTGASAFGTGSNLLTNDLGYAQDARNRQAQYGDFTQQTGALNQAQGYGTYLAGLEQQQGPSGAQAQLQAGTSQGLATQIALARSGRGFGGGAGAMGQAQTNMAGIQANQANQAALLSAQENAAWRGRQAQNLGAAAGISQGVGSQFGQQANANLSAYYQNQGQNDQTGLGYAGLGADSYYKGVSGQLGGLGLGTQVRGMEMQGGESAEDRMLRAWMAQNGYNQAQDAANRQQEAALIQGGATIAGAAIGTLAGPAGTAAGGAAGSALGAGINKARS